MVASHDFQHSGEVRRGSYTPSVRLAWTPRGLRLVGLATALLTAIPVAPTSRLPLWLASLALFVGLFWAGSSVGCESWSRHRRLLVLATTAGAALALVGLGEGALAAAYPVLAAAMAGSVLAPRDALAVVAAQTLLLAPAFLVSGFGPGDAALLALIFGALQLFVVHTAQVARAEGEARRELEAAQARFAAASRDAERLRIARDLHDVMGHHLTALSLTLEAASHGGDGADAAKDDQIAEALVLTKRLLRDIRQVVSTLRQDTPGLETALQRLAAEAKGPRVHLRVAQGLPAAPDEPARALVHCAQEAVTNAARHGGAKNLWLELSANDGGWLLAARDDGRAPAHPVEPGNGLRGLSERAAELGGWVRWQATAGGFELRAWLPGGA